MKPKSVKSENRPLYGLIYYLRRFYDPNLQRWINRDPIDELGGIDLYSFVDNDPISFADAFGFFDSSPILRATVPGQISWDNAVTSWQNGNYGYAAAFTASMLAEQTMYVLTLGQSMGISSTTTSSSEVVSQTSLARLSGTAGKGICVNGRVVAHAPIESIISHEQLAVQSSTLLVRPAAGVAGTLIPGAEAFTYTVTENGQAIVTGSMNFNTSVSQLTVDSVTTYLSRFL